jgi:hypothetical protein
LFTPLFLGCLVFGYIRARREERLGKFIFLS